MTYNCNISNFQNCDALMYSFLRATLCLSARSIVRQSRARNSDRCLSFLLSFCRSLLQLRIFLETSTSTQRVHTPWSTVLLKKLTDFQLATNFPATYATARFITLTTRQHESQTRRVYILPPYFFKNLHLHLGRPNNHLSYFSNHKLARTSYFCHLPCVQHAPPNKTRRYKLSV